MGISCLVSTGRPEVLDMLPFEVASMWMDVLSEIRDQETQSEDDRCELILISHPLYSSESIFLITHLTVARACFRIDRLRTYTRTL